MRILILRYKTICDQLLTIFAKKLHCRCLTGFKRRLCILHDIELIQMYDMYVVSDVRLFNIWFVNAVYKITEGLVASTF